MKRFILLTAMLWVWQGGTAFGLPARYMEKLDRGVVAVSKGSSTVYVSWRMLGTEPEHVSYHVYRNGTKITASPIATSCNYLDTAGSTTATYSVAAVIDGVEQDRSDPVSVWGSYYLGSGKYVGYKDIPLQRPVGGTTPDDVDYTYSPNDVSVGDLDGDGEYEIVLKWDPSNSKDNSQSGYTGNVYLDAYEMDGTFLWRIDLGINIRAGAHYTQFMVYDLDSDGKAEVVCKTADGTMDGAGTVLGNEAADYRNSSGYILTGPEYLSVFNGESGAFIDTVDYVPARGSVSAWGDNYGNRVDRFLACVAYLDGEHPSVVMCRGYYTRSVLAAWDLVDGELVKRWVFDSNTSGNGAYYGQGNHNLSVADVDADGCDEIIYGSCTIDHDGSGLYSTGLGHGDALHVSDMDPDRPGLEVWQCHEESITGATYRDAATGEILINHFNAGDVGRGVAAHIDSRYPGYQLFSYATNGVYSVDGTQISDVGWPSNAKMMGHLAWWTADLQREFFSIAGSTGGPILEKWTGSGTTRYISLYNIPASYTSDSINGSKGNPNLSGDILGDWREEIILRSSDNTKLRLFITTEVTAHRIFTLMHDPQYRLAMAWQNVGYNQPPHPGFYIGEGMSAPPAPNIVLAEPVPLPDAPTGLTAVGGDGQVELSWTAPANADSYSVKCWITSGGPYTEIGTPDTTNYVHLGTPNGTNFYYVVSAVNSAGEGGLSDEVHAVPSVVIAPDEYRISSYESLGSAGFLLTLSNGIPGHVYQLLSSASLLPADWQPVGESFLGNGVFIQFEVPIAGAETNRYFKLSVQRQ
ncbi:MAG: hypothetical protein JXR25_01275 [Pontiellaceae bacterium]|nr:hypothetical protein [Pontiellaceae bacterium]MBN2783431.1 hypothetical protein [Pontiellaceae bacterium]